MSLLSWIKGPEVVDNLFDKDKGLLVRAGGWINDLHHSTAEGVAANMERIKAGNAFVTSTLSENTIRSRTRRMIAVGWLQLEAFLILLTVVIAPYDMALAEFYFKIAFGWLMGTTTVAVIGFFFGTHMLRAKVTPGS
jgi:hypothetical protein